LPSTCSGCRDVSCHRDADCTFASGAVKCLAARAARPAARKRAAGQKTGGERPRGLTKTQRENFFKHATRRRRFGCLAVAAQESAIAPVSQLAHDTRLAVAVQTS